MVDKGKGLNGGAASCAELKYNGEACSGCVGLCKLVVIIIRACLHLACSWPLLMLTAAQAA